MSAFLQQHIGRIQVTMLNSYEQRCSAKFVHCVDTGSFIQ
jgi:hypothetical protein